MVKIIKRIIVGVGIALVLSCFSKFGLIGNVYAMSCDTDRKEIKRLLDDDINGYIPNNTQDNVYYYRSANTTPLQIPFEGYDYVEVLLPMTYVYSFTVVDNAYQNNTPVKTQIETLQQPLVYLEDNTNNPSNNSWIQGYSDGSFYHFKYFKKNYNKDTLNIVALRIGVQNFSSNKAPINPVELWLKVNAFVNIQYYTCDSSKQVENAIKENTEAVEKTNETISSSEVDNDKATSDIDNMSGKVASNGSITQLLTLPIQLYQSILNATSGGCSRFQLGSMFNHELTMPCINLQNLLGGTLYNIIDILCCGLFILSFRKKMVDIFNHMTSLNDRGNELE